MNFIKTRDLVHRASSVNCIAQSTDRPYHETPSTHTIGAGD